jgi:PiT family inorganic phosphate transporter
LATLRPIDAVSAEVVGAASVLASSAIGVPVSMTQATAGAVVGAVSSKSARRVRWESATRIVAAWLVTLPATVVGGFLFAILAKLTR